MTVILRMDHWTRVNKRDRRHSPAFSNIWRDVYFHLFTANLSSKQCNVASFQQWRSIYVFQELLKELGVNGHKLASSCNATGAERWYLHLFQSKPSQPTQVACETKLVAIGGSKHEAHNRNMHPKAIAHLSQTWFFFGVHPAVSSIFGPLRTPRRIVQYSHLCPRSQKVLLYVSNVENLILLARKNSVLASTLKPCIRGRAVDCLALPLAPSKEIHSFNVLSAH